MVAEAEIIVGLMVAIIQEICLFYDYLPKIFHPWSNIVYGDRDLLFFFSRQFLHETAY
jgi:hypothetical protein